MVTPDQANTTPVQGESASIGNVGDDPHVEVFGSKIAEVDVTIGPQFLNHFSENLYSSPNKAFEELVSNSWDAGASSVYIGISQDLSVPNAIVWVLDNGESMDLAGLTTLWTVADSKKRQRGAVNGRTPIGKFGVGKLSTYILANKLTYVCKAADGVIRTVTMDYSQIDKLSEKTDGAQLFSSGLHLDVKALSDSELEALLDAVPDGPKILNLVKGGVPKPKPKDSTTWEDEFGGEDSPVGDVKTTWTLVLLSSLKETGKKMQVGWIRRILRASLPLGSSISIEFNDELLTPTKIEIPIEREWIIGAGVGISAISWKADDGSEITKSVTESKTPYPHMVIEDIAGRITGRIRLYKDRISGVKSDRIEPSNGFHINILGRVINSQNPYFGLKDLNHASWAKFRATVRMDELDTKLAVTREDLKDTVELTAFKALLRAFFNKARTEHDSLRRAGWPKVGEVLTERWGGVPLEPLKQILIEGLDSVTGLPDFIDTSSVTDEKIVLKEIQSSEDAEAGALMSSVEFDNLLPESPLTKYDLAKRTVIVNKDHPFTVEHSETHEEQMLLRDAAVADILTNVYMLSIGVDSEHLRQTLEYRDQIYRLLAQISRKTGPQIAEMLEAATGHAKGLERIVGDALEYLGFVVQRLGQSGEPEGVAIAPITPVVGEKNEDHLQVNYRFTYDAKSSGSGKSQTGNLGIAGLDRHREKYEAAHILVVAPDFQVAEALLTECSKHGVTPMRARDLAKLLRGAMTAGPINLQEFQSVFSLTHPDKVSEWVDAFCVIAESRPRLSLDLFLEAVAQIGYKGVNAVHLSVIADRVSSITQGKQTPRQTDVRSIVLGLQVLVPHLVRLTGEGNVFFSCSPLKLREAIHKQLKSMPQPYAATQKEVVREGQPKTVYE